MRIATTVLLVLISAVLTATPGSAAWLARGVSERPPVKKPPPEKRETHTPHVHIPHPHTGGGQDNDSDKK
jgi:hypothetical protein